MGWNIGMLGGLVLRESADEERVQTKFYSQKAALLLARLAFPPVRSYGREELIELLWPESDLSAGRANLRNLLAALRRQLEPNDASRGQVIYATNSHIGLSPGSVTTDVALFEAMLQRARRAGGEAEHETLLREAISIYRGELLPGVYENWVIRERDRLTDAYNEALRSLSLLSQNQGDTAEARAIASRVTEVAEPAATISPSQEPIRPFLPSSRTRFFGRDRELRAVLSLLESKRIVTLTGVGGVGKSRLAREIAYTYDRKAGQLPVFVPLDAIRHPAQIAEKILLALTVAPVPGSALLPQAVTALRQRGVTLLVLDNFEHLLASSDEATTVVEAIQKQYPDLRLLITSQRALGGRWETAFVVSPLPIPAASGDAGILLQNPSVQLFVDRAQSVRSDFAVTARNAAAVAAVCRDLEGIPLSLEIAGARSLIATPWQLRAELEHRLAFLTRRIAPDVSVAAPRHRSIRSTLEWSYSLLSPKLARFFTRLAPFRGGFTAEEATMVCDESDTLGSIEELCQASLLCPEENDDLMRFCFLDTVHEFTREKLTESGDENVVRERHLTTFLRLAEAGNDALFGPEQDRWLHRLERDHDNLRAALSYATTHPETKGLQLGSALCRFWQTRGYLEEGRSWMRTLLAAVAPPKDDEERRIQARANNALGTLLTNANRFDEARAAFQSALDFYEQLGDPNRFGPLNNLGLIDLYNGDPAAAYQAFTRCLEIAGTDGDPKYLSSFLNNRGLASLHQGHWDAAWEDFEKALRLYTQIGNVRGIAKAQSSLGALALERSEPALAQKYFKDSLRLHESLQDFEGAALCYQGLAGLAVSTGDPQRAATLFGKSEAIRSILNVPVRPADQARYDALRDDLCTLFGEDHLQSIIQKQREEQLGSGLVVRARV